MKTRTILSICLPFVIWYNIHQEETEKKMEQKKDLQAWSESYKNRNKTSSQSKEGILSETNNGNSNSEVEVTTTNLPKQDITANELGAIILSKDNDRLTSLLDNGMDPNRDCDENGNSCVMYSSIIGNSEALNILLSHGGNPNVINNELTPLIAAIIGGNIQSVEILLKNNADPNLKVHDDASPLVMATYKGYQEISDLITDAGGKY